MSDKTDIVIIGAGLAGAATAYHLRRLGAGDIVVLEKESAPGQHSSGLNAAMVREHVEDGAVQRLASEGAAALRAGELCAFRGTGGVLVGMGDEDAARYFPRAAGRGLWSPGDGVVDPAGLLHTFLRGVDVRCRTELRRWHKAADGVVLETSAGALRARLLVNAAGPWAGLVGDLPLVPMNRHLFVTPPMAEIHPDWPFVWDVVHGLYFRPESGGLLLCTCDEEARAPGDYRVDHEVASALALSLARWQPQLRNVAIRTCWTGQRTFAADRTFVIGFDPRCANVFHVAGLGGHGVTTSYAVGRLAAETILAGPATPTGAFAPGRLLNGLIGDVETGELSGARGIGHSRAADVAAHSFLDRSEEGA